MVTFVTYVLLSITYTLFINKTQQKFKSLKCILLRVVNPFSNMYLVNSSVYLLISFTFNKYRSNGPMAVALLSS